MPTPTSDKTVKFDATLGALLLNSWLEHLDDASLSAANPYTDASGKTANRKPVSNRVLIIAPDLGSGVFTMLATVEAFALWRDTGTLVATPDGLTLGDHAKWARAAARKDDPIGLAYMAAQNVARWLPSNIDPPRAIDLYVPLVNSPGSGGQSPALAAYVTVGVIGVAASISAAVAYWASKREDALASVKVDSLRSAGAIEGAVTIAQSQIAAGQPVDPKLIQILKDAGAGKEVSRDWGAYVAGGVGVGLAGGAVGTIAVTR